MENNSVILILTERTDRAENLIFLLRLSNYEVIHITDSTEALNFLLQRQRSLQPVSLLLINGLEQQQQLLQMLNKLDRCTAILPILLTYKEEPPLDLLKCKESLKNLIQQCQIHETHACVREILHIYSQVHSQVS